MHSLPRLALIATTLAALAPAVSGSVVPVVAAEFARCVAADAKVEKLAGDFQFVEGPVWLPRDSALIFSDIPKDELKRWTRAGGVTAFRAPSRNANGNSLDAVGRLLTCEHSGRRVVRLEADGTLATLADSFDGKRLNSPNDIVERRDGTLWFTDPDYGLKTDPATKAKVGKEQAGNFVYRLDPKSGRLTAVVRDFSHPNGLAFSPDESKLYIADSGTPRHIRVFTVAPDGTLRDGRVFCTIDKGGPDGIRVDRDGRVWSSTGDGVQVFSPAGELIGRILTPESAANLCFGGEDGRTLFITARKSLYAIRVLVTGAAR
jgi:gluconolactonase